MPLITVLMPVYNAMPYLKETVESVLSQTFQDFEFLCVEDGSKDDSLAYLQSVEDKRMRILTKDPGEPNKGDYLPRNRGLAAAKGTYIAMMDADDLIPVDRLEKQLAYLMKNPDKAGVGGYLRSFGNNTQLLKVPQSYKVIRALTCFSLTLLNATLMVRKDALEKANITYPPIRYATDGYFASELALRCPVGNLKEVCYLYRIHSSSSSARMSYYYRHILKMSKTLLMMKVGFKPDMKDLRAHYIFSSRSGGDFVGNTGLILRLLVRIMQKATMPLDEKIILFGYCVYIIARRWAGALYRGLKTRVTQRAP